MTLVIFSVKNVRYSVDVGRVEEVIPLPSITPLANQPSFICGVVYLRGSAVPIIDLRKRLGYKDQPYALDNDIIIIKVQGKIVGLIVDKVLSVIDVQETQLMEVPNMIEGVDRRYISSVAHIDDNLILLLAVDQILTISEGEKFLNMDADPQKV